MAIDLSSSGTIFRDLIDHVGHKVEIVTYGDSDAAIECITCGCVLVDGRDEEEEE